MKEWRGENYPLCLLTFRHSGRRRESCSSPSSDALITQFTKARTEAVGLDISVGYLDVRY